MTSVMRALAQWFLRTPAPSTLDGRSRGRGGVRPILAWAIFGVGIVAVSVPRAGSAAVTPGAIPSTFNVGEQGEAHYTIPITAPAATGKLAPNLALSYDHLAGNGLAGMHWTLSGISVITRCGKTYAQDGVRNAVSYYTNDRLCLNGQRLVDFSGTYWAAGTQYRTEIETFQRVVPDCTTR